MLKKLTTITTALLLGLSGHFAWADTVILIVNYSSSPIVLYTGDIHDKHVIQPQQNELLEYRDLPVMGLLGRQEDMSKTSDDFLCTWNTANGIRTRDAQNLHCEGKLVSKGMRESYQIFVYDK